MGRVVEALRASAQDDGALVSGAAAADFFGCLSGFGAEVFS